MTLGDSGQFLMILDEFEGFWAIFDDFG